MKLTQSDVTGRLMSTGSPVLKIDASYTLNDRDPEGTYESEIDRATPTVCQDPEPRRLSARNGLGLPVISSVDPSAPEPLPRSTTPLAVIVSVRLTLNVPSVSSTAPRTPLGSGAGPDTASMAAWMASLSSTPESLEVCIAERLA